ncbi:hypothetical protein L4C34_04455 [Vibrio profundum]|uniref:polysaccharide biosynthesis C-terminal domain-containing protein n=1 Tax=Vibrio profundum TaxID=2910247 RepID=UPI003D0B4CD6
MIKVTEFNPIGSDERGETKSFSVKDYGEFVYITRKQGTLSGNSYHEGKNKGTNLKTFVLLQGEALIKYRHVESDEVKEIIVPPQSVVEISPYVVHNMFANSDILVLENNSIADIKADVIREQV